ncbi:MAG: small basic protein [Planctomycetota bacterium]|jgi:small basic protein (TIGR04137 family)|nr:small basic protein [Planctomycetota bacterium]
MSIHRSFAGSGGLTKHRNVLTRAERLERLKRDGKWDAEQGVFNLPKVRSIKGS